MSGGSTNKKKIVTRAAPEAEYLTLDEAALEMRCSRKSIENWALQGQLRLIRPGRIGSKRPKVLISRQEIHRFLRSKTQ
jgi:excisionase family DNA binding protein